MIVDDDLEAVSLDTPGLLPAVGQSRAGEVYVMAHVHAHPLLHPGTLDYHPPVAWIQRLIQTQMSLKLVTSPRVSRAKAGRMKYSSELQTCFFL